MATQEKSRLTALLNLKKKNVLNTAYNTTLSDYRFRNASEDLSKINYKDMFPVEHGAEDKQKRNSRWNNDENVSKKKENIQSKNEKFEKSNSKLLDAAHAKAVQDFLVRTSATNEAMAARSSNQSATFQFGRNPTSDAPATLSFEQPFRFNPPGNINPLGFIGVPTNPFGNFYYIA